MIPRWILTLLIVLIASGWMMRHDHTPAAVSMTGHHLVAATAGMTGPAAQEQGKALHASATGMSDACAIICLGMPIPGAAATQFAPADTERSLKRQFAAATHEGRLVGPGYRPPKSI